MIETKQNAVRNDDTADTERTDEMPGAETEAAMAEYYDMLEHPEKYREFSTFEELLEDALGDA